MRGPTIGGRSRRSPSPGRVGGPAGSGRTQGPVIGGRNGAGVPARGEKGVRPLPPIPPDATLVSHQKGQNGVEVRMVARPDKSKPRQKTAPAPKVSQIPRTPIDVMAVPRTKEDLETLVQTAKAQGALQAAEIAPSGVYWSDKYEAYIAPDDERWVEESARRAGVVP